MSGGNGEKSDFTNAGLVIIMVLLILLIMYWHYIFYYYLYLWRAFVIPVSFIFKYIPNGIQDYLFLWANGDKQNIFDGIYELTLNSNNHFFNENIESYDFINKFISKTIGPFIYLFLLYTSYIIYKKKEFNVWLSQKKNKTSVDQLIEKESDVWPNVKFLINEHPELEKDINSGPWRVAETPERFLTQNKLFKDVASEDEDDLYTLDVQKLKVKLEDQMGKRWIGFKSTELTKSERQIMAIILLKMLRKGKQSLELKKLISITHSTETIKFYNFIKKYKMFKLKKDVDKMVERTLSESVNTKEFKDMESKHAYFYTLMMEMLEQSRKDGVIATDFIWLRIKDRMLYMVLNNTGRRVSFAEVAGPWSHRIAEKEKNIKINSPKVMSAIKAFDNFIELTDDKYVSVEF